jgi:hypothetical protein
MPRQTATKRQTQSGGRERPTINVRISQPDLDLIDRAAKAHGTNRSVFLIEAATARAESVLRICVSPVSTMKPMTNFLLDWISHPKLMPG